MKELIEVLNPSIILNFDTQKGIINLQETDMASTLKQITLTGLSDELICSFDQRKIKQFSDFLSKKLKNINSKADFVIFKTKQKRVECIICELKSNSIKGISEQFLYTKLFIEYVFSLIRAYYEIDFAINYRFLLFSTKVNKPTVSNRSASFNKLQGKNNMIITMRGGMKKINHLSINEIYREFSIENY